MKVFIVIVSSVLVLILAIILGFRALQSSIEFPEVPDKWWGKGQPQQGSENKKIDIQEMQPINFPNKTLQDLHQRLHNTRYFENIENTQWEYGTNIEDLKEIVEYWTHKFDWRKQEKLLNSYKHFTARIDGIRVHYVHAKPETKLGKVIPILLIHGWPGSFYEFYKAIPLLTSSQNSEKGFSFEVICPSLPGYIFSEAAHKPGLEQKEIAKMFTKLMAALGFKSYYVQGGDWGSMIAKTVGVLDQSHVKGVHLNMLPVSPPYGPLSLLSAYLFPSWSLGSLREQRKILPLKNFFYKLLRESGYFHLQATKPETAGFALNDSPVGLAAYVIEKFFVCSACNSNQSLACLESHFTKDELLTDVMLYWLTGSMPSAMRLYKETPVADSCQMYPLKVPTGVAEFPFEVFMPPRSWIEHVYPNIVQYTEMPRGGHFAALEEPDLLVNDIWTFVEKVELASAAPNENN